MVWDAQPISRTPYWKIKTQNPHAEKPQECGTRSSFVDHPPCFYCLRQISGRKRCVDHVMPQSLREFNSYRNLVSCCVECNSWKGAHPAADFLRWLYRQDRLTAVELTQRFRAIKRLAAGKLRPVLARP